LDEPFPLEPETLAPEEEEWPANIVFGQYMAATDPAEREELQRELIRLVEKYSNAQIWELLQEVRPDLVNKILEGVLRGIPRFRGESSFTTWVGTIIRNVCRSDLRKRLTEKDRWLQFEAVFARDDEGDLYVPGPSEEEKAYRNLILESVKEHLSEEERILLELLLEGRSHAEIGKVLGCSTDAARQKKKRLFDKVKGKFGNREEIARNVLKGR